MPAVKFKRISCDAVMSPFELYESFEGIKFIHFFFFSSKSSSTDKMLHIDRHQLRCDSYWQKIFANLILFNHIYLRDALYLLTLPAREHFRAVLTIMFESMQNCCIDDAI